MKVMLKNEQERNIVNAILENACMSYLAESKRYDNAGYGTKAKELIKEAQAIQNIQKEIQFHCYLTDEEYTKLTQVLTDPPANMMIKDNDNVVKHIVEQLNAQKEAKTASNTDTDA